MLSNFDIFNNTFKTLFSCPVLNPIVNWNQNQLRSLFKACQTGINPTIEVFPNLKKSFTKKNQHLSTKRKIFCFYFFLGRHPWPLLFYCLNVTCLQCSCPSKIFQPWQYIHLFIYIYYIYTIQAISIKSLYLGGYSTST